MLLRCPHCERSMQIYPGDPTKGYFRNGATTDVCACCGTPLRLMEDGELAIASWTEWEFRNRRISSRREGRVPPMVRIPQAEDDFDVDREAPTKRSA